MKGSDNGESKWNIYYVTFLIATVVTYGFFVTDINSYNTTYKKIESVRKPGATTNEKMLKELFNISYPTNSSDAYEIYKNVIQPLHKRWDQILETKGITGGEGNSGGSESQTVFYINLILDTIKYYKNMNTTSTQEDINIIVCEIGYNMGHSALTYLFSDYIGRVEYLGFSFPIDNHQLILKTMKDTFKLSDRLTVLWGDSTKYLPYYINTKNKTNELHQCDIVIVDGGHTNPVPRLDIDNMKYLAKIPNHVLIVDDVGCTAQWCIDVTSAWDNAVESKVINKTECMVISKLRGFCWGKYNVNTIF
eukprot:540349_1